MMLKLIIVRAAHEANTPIAIVSIGDTRADDLASLKINARCGEVCYRSLFLFHEVLLAPVHLNYILSLYIFFNSDIAQIARCRKSCDSQYQLKSNVQKIHVSPPPPILVIFRLLREEEQ
jgi:hypothetical protein